MNPLELPGLQRVRGMLDGSLPAPSITTTMPMRVVAAERGRVTFTARADARHLNPMGGVHGGFMAAVLDSATGTAVQTLLEPGASYSTVDLHVQMLKPVPSDRDLTAEGRVLHASRNVAAAEADLRDADGTLLTLEIAEASADGTAGSAWGTTRGAITPVDGGAPTQVNDKFLAVLRCEDGTWRVARLAWSPQEHAP